MDSGEGAPGGFQPPKCHKLSCLKCWCKEALGRQSSENTYSQNEGATNAVLVGRPIRSSLNRSYNVMKESLRAVFWAEL